MNVDEPTSSAIADAMTTVAAGSFTWHQVASQRVARIAHEFRFLASAADLANGGPYGCFGSCAVSFFTALRYSERRS